MTKASSNYIGAHDRDQRNYEIWANEPTEFAVAEQVGSAATFGQAKSAAMAYHDQQPRLTVAILSCRGSSWLYVPERDRWLRVTNDLYKAPWEY